MEGRGAKPGLWELLLLWVFPARCLWCGRVIPAEGFFCKECQEKAGAVCARVFDLRAAGRSFAVRAPAAYRGGYRETLHRYKFRGERGLAGQLGRLCAGQARFFPVDFTAVAYVPLSKKRKRQRGYDQSRLLAKAIARALGVPLLGCLEKVRETETQHTLGKSKRMENVKGAYRASPAAAGKALLLVDDIVTTGATLCQCAEALYAAGAAEVYGLCAASAQKKEEDPHAPV